MDTQNYDHNEMFDGIGPENEGLADLLQRARFNPTPAYQTDLWQRLQLRQNQQHERSHNGMSLFPWSNLSRLFLRFGLLGATAAVSATIVVVVVLLGTLAVSPTARAQAQQLFARFVAVDSPEAFMAEQISKQRAEREAAQSGVTPAGDTSDTAAAGKGEVVQGSEGENSVTPAEPAQDTDRPSYLDQKQPFPGIVDDWRPDAPLASIPDDVVLPTHPRGNSLAASNLASLEEAQSKVSFTIHTPTWLPDGYSLQGVMVPPDLSSTLNLPARPANAPQLPAPTLATLNFSNGTDTFVLSQVQRPQVERGPAREMLLPIPNDRGSVQEITIKGQSAQYIEMGSVRQVHWQDANGVMYDLISNTLDQATLIRIAESVQ